MVLKGSNLVISADSKVLSCSRSCNISVYSDTIGISTPTDGVWRRKIAGRKSWSMTTNHLYASILAEWPKVTAFSPSWSDTRAPRVTAFGYNVEIPMYAGLTLVLMQENVRPSILGTYDTRNDSEAQSLLALLNGISQSSYGIVGVVSYDTFLIPEPLRAALSQSLHIPLSSIPLVTDISPRAIAMVGGCVSAARGLAIYADGRSSSVEAFGHYIDGTLQTLESVVKKSIMDVGNTYDIVVQVNGYGADRLRGRAICTRCEITATKGNLIQGSFAWEGDGSLE